MNLHFISGLPRSGSTLLAAILRQNPRFTAGMSSPMYGCVSAVQRAMSGNNELAYQLTKEAKWRVLRGIGDSLYPVQDVVFDTNRRWCGKMGLINEIWPKAKVIVCVRHVSWIMDSFECAFRRNPLDLSGMFDFNVSTTVYSRVNKLATSDGVVGSALDALREAFYGEHAYKLLVIDYGELAHRPQATMQKIYRFIGEPKFDHDFEHVEFAEESFDSKLGMPGLHTVRPKVEFKARQTILPPDLFNRFAQDDFWLMRERKMVG